MKRHGGKVFFYGAANENTIHNIIASLPFEPQSAEFAAEHFGHGLKINWDAGKNEARRRNYIAAMLCTAVVIIGRPRYLASLTTAFRQRGRRIFWYNPKSQRLVEVDVPDQVQRGLSALPKEATFEPTIWTEQREVRERETMEFLDEHPEAQRTINSIPTFGWAEVLRPEDVECSRDDVLHPRHAKKHRESMPDDFEVRRQAHIESHR